MVKVTFDLVSAMITKVTYFRMKELTLSIDAVRVELADGRQRFCADRFVVLHRHDG